MKRAVLVGVAFLWPAVLSFSQTPRVHDLKLLPHNVHWWYYDAGVKPVLRVASGDTIRVETMVARGLQRLRAAGAAESEIPDALKAVETAITERGPGAHPLTGPIWIEGADRGDVLEVKLLGFEFLHPYGVVGFVPGSGTLPDDFPTRASNSFVSTRGGFGVSARHQPPAGAILRIHGVARSLVGRVERTSRSTPGISTTELIAGSTRHRCCSRYVAVRGDGHGMLERRRSDADRVTSARHHPGQRPKGKRADWPRAETPTHYIAMGLHADLDQAAQMATRDDQFRGGKRARRTTPASCAPLRPICTSPSWSTARKASMMSAKAISAK